MRSVMIVLIVLNTAGMLSGQTCVLEQRMEITNTSLGSNLTGPFRPGETVSVCMNVDFVSASGNGCQWFQGLVPTFGDGWDPGSFDTSGQPLNATLNGQPFPVAGVLNESEWEWWEDVHYHHQSDVIQVGDFDQNGTLDICHTMYVPDCGGQGTSAAEHPPCWDSEPGTTLPPGWFASGVTGLCAIDGYPGVDWGDGEGCEDQEASWQFCFDLVVGNDTTKALRVGFMTFSDGEVGSWNAGPSACSLDSMILVDYAFTTDTAMTHVVDLDRNAYLKVYPIPLKSGSPLWIEMPYGQEVFQWTLFDHSGRIVQSGEGYSNMSISTTRQIPPGLYIISVASGRNTFQKKIVIE